MFLRRHLPATCDPLPGHRNGERRERCGRGVRSNEDRSPIHWEDIVIQEGAGAAFLTKKEEIAHMDGVSLLAETFVQEYC